MTVENSRLIPVTSIDDVPIQRKVPEMIRVPAAPALSGIAISATLFKLPTHYDGAITRLCPGEKTCALHESRELRLYYLLGFFDKRDAKVKWIQLTADAARSLIHQLEESQQALYGSCLKIARERPRIEAPVVIALDPYAKVHGRLCPPIDPQETIDRVFGTPDRPRQRKPKRV